MDCWSNVLCVWYQSAYTLYGIFVPRHSITKLSLIFGFIIFSPLCCNYLLQNGTWFRLVETYRRLWHFNNVTWLGKENVQLCCTFFVIYLQTRILDSCLSVIGLCSRITTGFWFFFFSIVISSYFDFFIACMQSKRRKAFLWKKS